MCLKGDVNGYLTRSLWDDASKVHNCSQKFVERVNEGMYVC